MAVHAVVRARRQIRCNAHVADRYPPRILARCRRSASLRNGAHAPSHRKDAMRGTPARRMADHMVTRSMVVVAQWCVVAGGSALASASALAQSIDVPCAASSGPDVIVADINGVK